MTTDMRTLQVLVPIPVEVIRDVENRDLLVAELGEMVLGAAEATLADAGGVA